MRNIRRRARSIRRLIGTTALGTVLAGTTMYANFKADDYFGMVKSDWAVTRASSGFAENLAGVLQSFSSNVLRRTDKGVLIEPSSTNLVLQSQTFGTTWGTSNGSVSSDVTTAPDGTTTADAFIENSTAATPKGVNQNVTAASNVNYTLSCYVKLRDATRPIIRLFFDDNGGANLCSAYFNISNGTVGTVSNGGTGTGATGRITALANGWYRCVLAGKCSTVNTSVLRVILRSCATDNTPATTGDGVSGVYLWGAQLEADIVSSSYIVTTTTSATRAADAITISGSTLTKWFTSGPGTVFVRYLSPRQNGSNNRFVFTLGDGTTNNRVVIFQNASNAVGYRVAAGGVSHLSLGSNVKTANNPVEAVISWQANSQVGSDDGNNAVTGSGSTNPTVDRLQLGQDDAGSSSRLLGWIEYIEYSPAPIDAATAKVISAP